MKVSIYEAENLDEEVITELSQVLAGLAFAKNVVDVVKVVKVSAFEHLAFYTYGDHGGVTYWRDGVELQLLTYYEEGGEYEKRLSRRHSSVAQ